MVEFTTRIKEFRAREGFTQAELAEMVDVRREMISHLERVRYNSSLELAYRVSRALDTTIRGAIHLRR